jgi:hypothetical protein
MLTNAPNLVTLVTTPFEDHFWLIVGELADFFVEPWSDKLLARIAARPAHLLHNVLNCEPTRAEGCT